MSISFSIIMSSKVLDKFSKRKSLLEELLRNLCNNVIKLSENNLRLSLQTTNKSLRDKTLSIRGFDSGSLKEFLSAFLIKAN